MRIQRVSVFVLRALPGESLVPTSYAYIDSDILEVT
jgi:hypothetical protein